MEKIRAEGCCRYCALRGLPTKEDGGVLNRAHIIGKGQRGDDVDENIVPLCGSGTCGCHAAFDGQQPYTTYPSKVLGASTQEVRAVVLAGLLPEERAYVINKKGAAWLPT